MTPEVRASWQPQLNEEHTAFEWIPLSILHLRKDLHPVVKLVLLEEPHKSQVGAALASLDAK